jgi:hypothetical protein
MTRGWTSQNLPRVDSDDTLWTITEAAHALGPLPGDPEDTPVKDIIDELRLYARRMTAVGKRRTGPEGHPGRCARAYRATDFIALYQMLDHTDDEKPPAAA